MPRRERKDPSPLDPKIEAVTARHVKRSRRENLSQSFKMRQKPKRNREESPSPWQRAFSSPPIGQAIENVVIRAFIFQILRLNEIYFESVTVTLSETVP